MTLKKLSSKFSLICLIFISFWIFSCGSEPEEQFVIESFDLISVDQSEIDAGFISFYCRMRISDPDGLFRKGSVFINKNRLLNPQTLEDGWQAILKQNFPDELVPEPANLLFSLEMNQKDLENLPQDRFNIIIYLRDENGQKSNTVKAVIKYQKRSTLK